MASSRRESFIIDGDECNNAVISVKENRRVYTLVNPNRLKIRKTHADGDMYTEFDGKRCDYILSSSEFKTAILVELKGRDVEKACEQISATLDDLESKFSYSCFHGRIVSSRTPTIGLWSTNMKKLSQRLKQSGGSFVPSTGEIKEYVDAGFHLTRV